MVTAVKTYKLFVGIVLRSMPEKLEETMAEKIAILAKGIAMHTMIGNDFKNSTTSLAYVSRIILTALVSIHVL